MDQSSNKHIRQEYLQGGACELMQICNGPIQQHTYKARVTPRWSRVSWCTSTMDLSFELGRVPSTWHTAVITPVPKCTPITGPWDLRPISVTPILSRVVKQLVVKDQILPAIPIDDLQDQYVFKPTGSTTAAIINITHAVTVMLECNKYVRCLLVDFSIAFDSVDHLVLVKKLKGTILQIT